MPVKRDSNGRFIKGSSSANNGAGQFKKGHKGFLKKANQTSFKKGMTPWNKGLKGYRSGKIHHNWKGGITTINEKVRKSIEYKKWREAVFKRDSYRCTFCNKSGNKVFLHADHIKPFALFPKLRFKISNGRTLCKDCHRKTDTYGFKTLIQKERNCE